MDFLASPGHFGCSVSLLLGLITWSLSCLRFLQTEVRSGGFRRLRLNVFAETPPRDAVSPRRRGRRLGPRRCRSVMLNEGPGKAAGRPSLMVTSTWPSASAEFPAGSLTSLHPTATACAYDPARIIRVTEWQRSHLGWDWKQKEASPPLSLRVTTDCGFKGFCYNRLQCSSLWGRPCPTFGRLGMQVEFVLR